MKKRMLVLVTMLAIVLLAVSGCQESNNKLSGWIGGHESTLIAQAGVVTNDTVEYGVIYRQSTEHLEDEVRDYDVGAYACAHFPCDPNNGLQIPVPWGGGETIAAQAFGELIVLPDFGRHGGTDISWGVGARFAEIMYIKYNPDMGIGQEVVSAGINLRTK
jgi:hypothetical protein